MVGKTLGGYRLLKLLGRGGMGEVYLAEHERLKVKYAFKVLPEELSTNPEFVKRFYTEARVMASLEHPHIVKVVNLGEEQGTYYLVMDYVEREHDRPSDLRELLEAGGGRLPPDTAADILSQICDAVAYAHNQGVVHRDLKPANVLMDAEGRVKVTDFGLAKVVGGEYLRTRVQQSVARSVTLASRPGQAEEASSGQFTTQEVTATYALLGTYDYMSPEQKLGRDVDARSDIYALGVLIQTLLTGVKPVGAFKYPSEAVRGISKRWDAIVRRCLQDAPESRYQSVTALAEDLEALGRRSRAKAAVAVVGLLTVIMVISYLTYRSGWQRSAETPQVPGQPQAAVTQQPGAEPATRREPGVQRPGVPEERPVGLAEAAEAKAAMEVARERVSGLEATGCHSELFESARQAALAGETLLQKDSHGLAADRFQAATDIYGQVEVLEGQYQEMAAARARAESARSEADKAGAASYAKVQYEQAEGYGRQAEALEAQREYVKARDLFARAEGAYREAQSRGQQAREAQAARSEYEEALARIGLARQEAEQLGNEAAKEAETAFLAGEAAFQNGAYTEAKQAYEQAAGKVPELAVACAGLHYAEAVRLLNEGEGTAARSLRQRAVALDSSLGDWQKHPEFFTLAKSAWPMFRGGLSHTGRSAHDGPGRPKVTWTLTTGGSVDSSPAIGDEGTVYVGSRDGHLYALSPSGTLNWKVLAGGEVRSSPAVAADGTVYVGAEDGNLYAIGPSGEVTWKVAMGSPVRSSPAIAADGTVYVSSRGGNSQAGKLYALTPQGQVRWEVALGDVVASSPTVSSDGTVYVGSFDDTVYAVSPSGAVRWKVNTEGDVQSSPAVGEDGTVYVGSWDGELYAIAPSGMVTWKVDTGSPVLSSAAIAASGTVYLGSWNGSFCAVSPSGTLNWKVQLEGHICSSPAVGADGTVYVGSDDGHLYAIAPSGSIQWQTTVGKGIWSSPAVGTGRVLYVGSDDGKLYAVGD